MFGTLDIKTLRHHQWIPISSLHQNFSVQSLEQNVPVCPSCPCIQPKLHSAFLWLLTLVNLLRLFEFWNHPALARYATQTNVPPAAAADLDRPWIRLQSLSWADYPPALMFRDLWSSARHVGGHLLLWLLLLKSILFTHTCSLLKSFVFVLFKVLHFWTWLQLFFNLQFDHFYLLFIHLNCKIKPCC